jgi:DNA repair photolyase
LESLLARPPRVFVLQTRGPLIVRDLALIQRLAAVTKVRVSFSLTTNREQVRRWFEPRCATFEERLATMRCLRAEGVDVYATLAPLLPCDPEEMAQAALRATGRDLIGDPFHVRAVKRHGATTRQAALKICGVRDFQEWLDPRFQASVIEQIRRIAEASGRRFGVGEEGFSWLART